MYPNSSLLIFEDTLSSSIPFFTYELLKWNDTFFGVAYDRISKTQKYLLLNQSLGLFGYNYYENVRLFVFFYKTLGHVGGNNWRRKLTTFLLIYQIIDLRLSSENHFFK